MRVIVTDAQIRSWRLRGYSLERIASACGSTTSQISLRIQRIWQERAQRLGDPGPDEIRQACEEIQRGWSPSERAKRLVGRGQQWRPAVVPASLLAPARS